jgi:hypothetical protein
MRLQVNFSCPKIYLSKFLVNFEIHNLAISIRARGWDKVPPDKVALGRVRGSDTQLVR